MCIYSPMPHTLSYCALIGKCALIRSNTVFYTFSDTKLTDLFCPPSSVPIYAFAEVNLTFKEREIFQLQNSLKQQKHPVTDYLESSFKC